MSPLSMYFLAKVQRELFPWVTCKWTAVLPEASIFGGPVYSSVHGLDVCSTWEIVLPHRACAGCRDLRIQRAAPSAFKLWKKHEQVLDLEINENLCFFVLLIFFLPSYDGASLFVNGLILESTLRSAADDRSTKREIKSPAVSDQLGSDWAGKTLFPHLISHTFWLLWTSRGRFVPLL